MNKTDFLQQTITLLRECGYEPREEAVPLLMTSAYDPEAWPEGYEYARVMAISRVTPDEIRHIQLWWTETEDVFCDYRVYDAPANILDPGTSYTMTVPSDAMVLLLRDLIITKN